MTSSCPRLTVITLVVASSLTACGTGSRGPRTTPEPARHGTAPGATSASGAGRYPYTEADVRFMSHMIGHHAQAIVIAGWAPTHGASPSVRVLAERIINAQQDEIASMQRWLGDRGKPVPELPGSGMTMEHSGSGHDHAGHGMPMPGMLSRAQLEELDQARGHEFDRLFLTLMIQHHRGAVDMVKDLFGSPGAAQDETVFKFANDVSVDQSTEIARMEKMLAALTP
ncbi:MAG TPA: DUF305 domain-containing protein [Gemmatimonadales bacterium]